MSRPGRRKAFDLVVAERWRRLLSDVGPLSVARQVASYEQLKVDSDGPPPQVFIQEMFVSAEPALRRTLDLLCVGLIERGAPDGNGRHTGELVLLGPETIRTHTTPNAAGLTIADLRIGSAGPEVRAVSMMLMRINRTTRAHDVVVSIEDLGRLLDYQHDIPGSTAVAHAIVRRLEVLVEADGTEVPVMGTISRLGDAPGVNVHYLLVNSESPLSFDDEMRVRDGHLVMVEADGRVATWRGSDFMLVRIGQPPVRRAEARSLAQLRREHEAAEAGLGRGTAPARRYSSRAAVARQSSRADQIVRYALSGDTAQALTTFSTAATEPGADGPLLDSIASRVTSVNDYWMARGVLAEAAESTEAPAGSKAIARVAQERLGDRLDQLLGLVSDLSSEQFTPVVRPLVFEVSDALVPLVDSRQDGGLFLFELIPTMRERIRTSLGVRVPGVFARGDPSLAPGRFTIQVDEVPVENGQAMLGGWYSLLPLGDEPPDSEAELADFHPLTGEPGLWQIKAVWDHPAAEGTDHLTPTQYLIHQIDMVFRAHLPRFLDLQVLAAMMEQWTAAEQDLVAAILPDQVAAARLSWVLQTLVSDRVPITDWRAILGAVRDAGGITRPVPALVQAARAQLRGQLPGPRSGNRVLRVPPPLQDALARHLGPPRLPPSEETHEFHRWLRERVTSIGPAFSLVARDENIRVEVAALARPHYRLVTTFTEEDLASG